MAPALSSSFLPGQPSAKLTFRPPSPRSNPAAVFAKQSGGNGAPAFPSFRIGAARVRPEEQDESPEDLKKRKNPFLINIGLGKLAKEANGSLGASTAALVFSNRRRKDPLTVFVAGAAGQVGARVSRSLLRRGFSVRAGVPDLAAAQEVARIAAQYKIITLEESRRLNAVESGFADAEEIARAIGNAAKVVVAVGRGENGPAAPVSTDDAFLVARAAELAGVRHVLIIYDSAAGSPEPSTNNVLDGITSFFSNLFSPGKPSLTVGQLLEKLATETDLSYTLVKVGLSEDYGAGDSGLEVAGEGAGGDSRVSWSQIASLAADVLGNVAVAENKVVEVSAIATAQSRPVDELFSGIAEDGRRKAYKEAAAKKKAEEEAVIASEKAQEAAEMAKKLGEEVKKLSEQEARAARLTAEARRKAEEAGASLESILAKAKGLGGDFSWDKLGTQFTAAMTKSSDEEEPKVQIATVRGQAKARALPAKKAVVKSPPPKTAQQPDVKKVFGGLFRQETIYVDDD